MKVPLLKRCVCTLLNIRKYISHKNNLLREIQLFLQFCPSIYMYYSMNLTFICSGDAGNRWLRALASHCSSESCSCFICVFMCHVKRFSCGFRCLKCFLSTSLKFNVPNFLSISLIKNGNFNQCDSEKLMNVDRCGEIRLS